MAPDISTRSVTEGLAALLRRPISATDRERAVLHLIDWMGCALAGWRTATGQTLATEVIDQLAISGETSPHRLAGLAFDLGGLGSILEMDDLDREGLLHPGPVVVPAALAIAGETNGTAFLDALVCGYEAMIRLGRAVGPGHYAFFHNTSTCGGIGAAAAAGAVLGLSDTSLVWAMGNATSVAGGFWQCRHEQVMTKPFHCAESARRGTMAALLAQRGLTGPRNIMEGPHGMFAAICPDGRPEDIFADGDGRWRIHEVSFKPWPACRHVHAAIDAALGVRERIGGRPIDRIDIVTYADAIAFCDRMEPQTEIEAKFSLQHAVAVALLDDPSSMQSFAADATSRPDIAQLRRCSHVVSSATYSSVYPRHFGASVTVTTSDGDRLTHQVDDAPGDSENPLDREAILAKFHTLAEHAGLGDTVAAGLAATAFSLLDDRPVVPLRTMLSKALAS